MNSEKTIKEVTLSFTGKIDNGEIFIEVTPDNPLTIVLGNSELPPSVELIVSEMEKGEQKCVRVSPEEGYGQRTKDLLHEVPKSVFGDTINPRPGMIISQTIEREGVQHKVPVTIMELKEKTVVIDYNHPLAGHNLTYDIKVLDIKSNN